MSFITAENLYFSYPTENNQKIEVLKNINIAFEEGSYTAILGHNGSGKSTLAKLLCGILQPASGKIIVNGLDTSEPDNFYKIRRLCGMVFQNPDNQIVATVVEEDVAFAPENLGIKPELIRKTVDECLKTVGMYDYRLHSTYKLSGGQKQRIAIAGILAMNPRCIIFDEATAMLDPIGRKEIMEALKKLNKELGITVITITHYMNEAVEADRVIVLSNGEIITDGTPREVFSQKQLLFDNHLTLPQVTELFYKLEKEGFCMPDGVLHTMEAADILEKMLK